MKLKKILAGAMAGAMVLGSLNFAFADDAEEVTLSSTGWWSGVTGVELTADSTAATWTYTILANEEISDFGIEVYDADGKYITTLTNGEGWYAGATGDDLVIDSSSISSSLTQGETYTVTVVREDGDFVITYFDSTGATLLTFTAANTDIATSASVHFYAQYGAFTVNASVTYESETVYSEDTSTEDDTSTEENASTEDSTSTEEDASTEEDTSSENSEETSYTTVVATVDIDDLTAEGFWTVFSDGLELVDGQQIVITGTTTNNGDSNWDNVIYVLYSSDDAAIYAARSDEATAANYAEYFVGRLDVYGWGTASYEVTSYPDDWDAWLAATQAGAEFTITVTYVDGTIQIVSSCEGAEYVMTYAVEDSSTTYYVALTGEQCTLTNLVATYYEADASSIVETTEADSSSSSESSDSSSSSSSEASIAATYFGTSSATAVTTITTTGTATYDDGTGYTAVEIDTTDLEEGVKYVIVIDDTAYEAYVEDGVLYIKGDVSEYDLDGLTIYEADDEDDGDNTEDDPTGTSDKDTGDTTPVIPVAVALFGCAVVVFAAKKRMA